MKRVVTALIAATLLAAGPSLASKDDDKVKLAAEAISIDEAIDKATEQYPNSRVVEAELDDDHGGRWELKVADADGTIHDVRLDARTGEPQESKRQ